MGCDSHVYIERRKGSKWQTLTAGSRVPSAEREEPLAGLKNRNYDLFAVLAGVRNGIGVKPLFKGRGLPEDIGSAARKEHHECESDYHSATWFTVEEVQAFDWASICQRTTYLLPAHAFLEWQKAGRIVDSSDLVSSQTYRPSLTEDGSESGCRIVTEEEMALLLLVEKPEIVSPLDKRWQEMFKKLGGKSKKLDVRRCGAFARVKTPVTYRAVVPDFVSSTLPALVALGKPKDTRVLMWFDN